MEERVKNKGLVPGLSTGAQQKAESCPQNNNTNPMGPENKKKSNSPTVWGQHQAHC